MGSVLPLQGWGWDGASTQQGCTAVPELPFPRHLQAAECSRTRYDEAHSPAHLTDERLKHAGPRTKSHGKEQLSQQDLRTPAVFSLLDWRLSVPTHRRLPQRSVLGLWVRSWKKAPSRSEALLPARTPTPPLQLLRSKLPLTASDPTPREPPSSPATHSCPPVILPGKCGRAHFTGEELRLTEARVSTCRSKWQLHISNSKLLMPHIQNHLHRSPISVSGRASQRPS